MCCYLVYTYILLLQQAVGAAAKQGIVRNAQNTVCNVKQILGRTADDEVLQQYMDSCTVKVRMLTVLADRSLC